MKSFTIKINEDVIIDAINEKLKLNKTMIYVGIALTLITLGIIAFSGLTKLGIVTLLLSIGIIALAYMDYKKALELQEKIQKGDYKIKFEGSEDSFGDKIYLTFTIE